MIDEKFLPDEIRNEEDIKKMIENKDIDKLVSFLKECRLNLVNLEPLKFSIYAKIRANLLRLNVNLTDNDIINLNENELKEHIIKQLYNNIELNKLDDVCNDKLQNIEIQSNKNEEEKIKEVITADVNIIEEERVQFRKALLDENLKIKIKRGNNFVLKMNKKNNVMELILPSWDIEIDDVLLLDLYDKRFSYNNTSKIESSKKFSYENNIYFKIADNNDNNNENQKFNIEDNLCDKILELIKYKNDYKNIKYFLTTKYNFIKNNINKYKNFDGGVSKLATSFLIDCCIKFIKNNKISINDLENINFSKNILNKIKNKLEENINE